MGVLAVVINYKRPQNVAEVLRRLRPQVDRLVVADNGPAPYGGEAVYDDVWSWRENAGCASRFYPALAELNHEYTLFVDDDVLPAEDCVAKLLAADKQLKRMWSTLGQVNRVLLTDSLPHYHGRRSVAPTPLPQPVHLICQLTMVQTQYLHHVLGWRSMLRSLGCPVPLLRIHDDFLLNFGVQHATRLPSFCISDLIQERLPEWDCAVWRRPEHFAEREAMSRWCLKAGWKPCS